MRLEDMNFLAQCSLGLLAGLLYGAATGAITSAVGSSILTNFNSPCDMSELVSIGAVGGAVLGGCGGFFARAGAIATNRLSKLDIETLPLHLMLSEILYCLIGFAILHPAIPIEQAIFAFAIGGAVMNYPFMLCSGIARGIFCPETMTLPEEIPLSGYGSV